MNERCSALRTEASRRVSGVVGIDTVPADVAGILAELDRCLALTSAVLAGVAAATVSVSLERFPAG